MPLFCAAEARWHAGSIAEEKAARRDVVNMVTAACGLAGHRHSQRWRRQHQTAAEAEPARCNSPVTFGESKAAPAPCASEISLSAGSTRLVESLPRKGREHRKSGPPQPVDVLRCSASFQGCGFGVGLTGPGGIERARDALSGALRTTSNAQGVGENDHPTPRRTPAPNSWELWAY